MRIARAVPGLVVAVAAVVVLGAAGCGRGAPAESLLAGKLPARADGVATPALLTDGQQASEGADWNAPPAAILQGDRAFVDYDLGKSVPIAAAYLQGDNNDDYVVAVSEDGNNFRELWVARPVATAGLRGRAADGLGGQGRWIRLSARGGDRVYSVTELQLWSRTPAPFPPHPEARAPELRAASVRTMFIYLVLAFALVLFATREGGRARWTALLWLAPAVAAVLTARAIFAAWPLAARELSFARASAAAIVLLALFRGWERARAAPPHRKTVVAACAFGAVLAFACFFNLGRLQAWNHAERRLMFVHAADMRIYQPFVKYFDELRYDGVYLASLLAYAEDERGGSLASLAGTRVRDLRDYRMRPAGELTEEIAKVRKQFTPERWAAFKADLRFFRSAMGPDFLTMEDHGANAPPSWVWVASLFLGHVTASETTLTMAGLVDVVLFLAMAWAMWACFGLLPMLVAMTVFGATELYMFGTNWAGATLRHDWLALLTFAACALRRQRWLLAGVLLGLGTMLRILPAVGLLGVAAPAVGWLVAQGLKRRRPILREILTEHGPAVRVLAAAAATIAVTFIITGALYGFSAWGEWWTRIALYNRDLGVNEVNLRMLVAGVDQYTPALLRERMPIYVLVEIAAGVLVVLAARGRPLEEAMLLGLPLVFVLLHPVNYHGHLVFLLVLVGARSGEALLAAAAPLLVMCLGGYWAVLDPDAVRRFELMSVLLFAALGWLYFVQLRLRPAAIRAK